MLPPVIQKMKRKKEKKTPTTKSPKYFLHFVDETEKEKYLIHLLNLILHKILSRIRLILYGPVPNNLIFTTPVNMILYLVLYDYL